MPGEELQKYYLIPPLDREQALVQAIQKDKLVLYVGPRSSGKTTTLRYAAQYFASMSDVYPLQ